MPITIDGLRPLAITKRQAAQALGNKRTLLERMIWAVRNQPRDRNPWLVIVSNRNGRPGEELTLDTESVERAYARLLAGEEPPRIPRKRHRRRE